MSKDFKLIILVVPKGKASKIVATAKKAGAEGGTIFYGRGIAERKIYEKILGIEYEPEKEVVLIIVRNEKEEKVVKKVAEVGEIEKPGQGICIVIDLNKCTGISHLINNKEAKK